MTKSIKIIFPLLLLLLVTSCNSFNRDWGALAKPQPTADPMEGRWDGSWLSSSNGHDGRLRCIISKSKGKAYLSRYRANYAVVLRFEYAVPLAVEKKGEVYHFTGRADLGKLAGGLYTYKGTVVGDEFTATYDSKYDKGTFTMTRKKL